MLAKAACSAAAQVGLPAVARTAPSTRSGWLIDLGAETTAARATQRSAAAAHSSQSEALPELQHHLDLLGGNEQLRWLIPPDPTAKRHHPVLALAEPVTTPLSVLAYPPSHARMPDKIFLLLVGWRVRDRLGRRTQRLAQ